MDLDINHKENSDMRWYHLDTDIVKDDKWHNINSAKLDNRDTAIWLIFYLHLKKPNDVGEWGELDYDHFHGEMTLRPDLRLEIHPQIQDFGVEFRLKWRKKPWIGQLQYKNTTGRAGYMKFWYADCAMCMCHGPNMIMKPVYCHSCQDYHNFSFCHEGCYRYYITGDGKYKW